jgi:hypothetical protein
MARYTSFAVELTGALDAARDMSAIPGRILQAQKRALGTLRRRLATEAKRDIRAEYNLKAGRIAQGLVVRDASDGVRLIGRSRGINAIEFRATWSKRMKGARFAVKRGGDRSARDGSFIATGKSGNRLVFERGGKGAVPNARGKFPRLPLAAVYGPSIGQMLKHGRRPERLAEFAIRILEAEQRRLLGSH